MPVGQEGFGKREFRQILLSPSSFLSFPFPLLRCRNEKDKHFYAPLTTTNMLTHLNPEPFYHFPPVVCIPPQHPFYQAVGWERCSSHCHHSITRLLLLHHHSLGQSFFFFLLLYCPRPDSLTCTFTWAACTHTHRHTETTATSQAIESRAEQKAVSPNFPSLHFTGSLCHPLSLPIFLSSAS